MGWVGAPDPAPSSFFLTGSPPYYLPIDATFISPAARRPTRHRPAPVAQRPPRHRPAPAARPLHLARSTHSQDTRRGHAVQMQRGCRRPPVEKRSVTLTTDPSPSSSTHAVAPPPPETVVLLLRLKRRDEGVLEAARLAMVRAAGCYSTVYTQDFIGVERVCARV
ncbi:proline-rich receptor-like protein kinase PERK10 isoform X6 [Triticum aestivum]|uniref:proline-rich receptor-like protein kinase PERK10 isoform X6 n=1 Tax=Triticum aestivum TaxID=4565 RepID=UPI001D02DE94|nr:proline-rich receptor-like protein kinase PERK10 isoform X6 [Triticum aestivum]